MTTYKYKGLSPDGAKLSGVIKAYNEFEAVAQLRETCSVITKIEEVKETQSWNKQIGTKKIKDKELARLLLHEECQKIGEQHDERQPDG